MATKSEEKTHIPILQNVLTSNDDKHRGNVDTGQEGPKDMGHGVVTVGVVRKIHFPEPVQHLHGNQEGILVVFSRSPVLPAEEGLDQHQPLQAQVVLPGRSHCNVVCDVATRTVATQKRPRHIGIRRQHRPRLLARFHPLQCRVTIIIRSRALVLWCSPATVMIVISLYGLVSAVYL